MLTISDSGGTVAKIAIQGAYKSFAVQSDGSGGILVTDPPLPNSATSPAASNGLPEPVSADTTAAATSMATSAMAEIFRNSGLVSGFHSDHFDWDSLTWSVPQSASGHNGHAFQTINSAVLLMNQYADAFLGPAGGSFVGTGFDSTGANPMRPNDHSQLLGVSPVQTAHSDYFM